jgi:hypothetical protein
VKKKKMKPFDSEYSLLAADTTTAFWSLMGLTSRCVLTIAMEGATVVVVGK